MRSILATFVIAAFTVSVGSVAVWQFRDGNLHRMLGKPPTELGSKLFPEFDPNEAATITLKTGQTVANFVKTPNGWQATKPWNDRMDARAAIAILGFTSSTTAQDLVPRDKMDPEQIGMAATSHEIHIRDAMENTIAFYRLGRKTPWEYLPEESNGEKPAPTIYLLPLESGRKSHIYAASGDILPLFKDNFRYLRDHRPFYVNPLYLQKMRIKTSEGELTLGRATPQTPWRILKPLDLGTDPEKMKNLLERLVELQALKVSSRSEVTVPTDGVSTDHIEIAISYFGAREEISLKIFPPKQEENARTAQAIVSDRPDTVFHLPLNSEPDLISIADLPLTVNELREATLTNLNIASIRGVAIESAASPTIMLSRQPPSPWIVTINEQEQIANEQRLYELLKAVTEARAISFVTDSAPDDLSPWGLDRPLLKLVFLGSNHQVLTIHFGMNLKGDLFAMRKDSRSIIALEASFLDQIAVREHEWRHARLGSFNRVDLISLKRHMKDAESLQLDYDFIGDTWKALKDGKDVTPNLDPLKANFLIGVIENLQVSSWLSKDDPEVQESLKDPLLTLEITKRLVDEFGDQTGVMVETISIGFHKATAKFYGKLAPQDHYFSLPDETCLKLGFPLLDQ